MEMDERVMKDSRASLSTSTWHTRRSRPSPTCEWRVRFRIKLQKKSQQKKSSNSIRWVVVIRRSQSGEKKNAATRKKRKWGNGRIWFRGNLRREMKKTESGALWNIGTFHEHHLPVLELLTAQQVDVDEFGVGTPARRHQFHQSRLRRRLSHRNPPPKKRNPVKHFRWCCHHHLSRSIESLWVEFLFF